MDTSPNADSISNNSWLTKSPVSKHRRQHSCTRCRHHGMVEVRVLNHQCPYKSCTCSSCVLVKQRALMYRSKNTKNSSQRDLDNEQYDVDSQGSPAGALVPNYGSGSVMDPMRNPRHQVLRASPAAVESPPARSNFCPSPWDSKSSSGSSYSSTPGLEWQQYNQQHAPFQQSHNFHPSYQEAPPIPAVDGKINDFRTLCMTFPDYSVSQLQVILEESGNDFDRAVDTILLKRWTDDSVKVADVMCNPSGDPPPFNSGSAYLNNIYDRHMTGVSHPSNNHHVSVQPSLAQNGFTGYPAGHYSNSNNVLASSYAQHPVQPHTPQAHYPSQMQQQSNHNQMTGASPLDHHLQYNGTSYGSNPNGSNACNYYGSPPSTQTTYSNFCTTPAQQSSHYSHTSQSSQQKINLSRNPSNGSGYPPAHNSGGGGGAVTTSVTNGQSHPSYVYSSSASSHVNRSDPAMTYQDLSGNSANVYTGPRSFAATVVSQSQPTPTHQSLTETMLNRVNSPGSPGESYQQLIADEPLPLNEAMAVPIKRKRGRPKKVPGSPPVKRTIKKVAQESNHPQNSSCNDHTVTTSAIFKVPQAVNEHSPVSASHHHSTSPSMTPLPDSEVNGRSQDDSSLHDSSSWPISSPPQTESTLNSSPSSTLSPPPPLQLPVSLSNGTNNPQVQSDEPSTISELQTDLVITKPNDQPLKLTAANATTTDTNLSPAAASTNNQDMTDQSTKLDSSRQLSHSVNEEHRQRQPVSKGCDLKTGDFVTKSKSNRDHNVQGMGRRPVTRSSAHRFASV